MTMMIMMMIYFMPCIIIFYDQPIFTQSFQRMLTVSQVLICLSCHDHMSVRLSQLRLNYWMDCHEIWYEYHKTKIHPPFTYLNFMSRIIPPWRRAKFLSRSDPETWYYNISPISMQFFEAAGL
jgi:hypothetical protein